MPLIIVIYLVMILTGVAYTSVRLWLILPLALWSKWLAVLLWLLPLGLMIGYFFAREALSEPLTSCIYNVGTAWIFVLLYAVILFLVFDLAAWGLPQIRPYLYSSLYGSVGVGLTLLGIFIYGNTRYHDKVRVGLDVPIAKAMARPLKIVGISDLHLGYTIGRCELARWVDMINQEHPDLILIAGDLVDGDVRPVLRDSMYLELNRLEARLGVYASLGNHEYIGGEAQEGSVYARTNIRLLRDEAVLVDDAFYIIGRDDRSNPKRSTLAQLTEGLDRDKPLLLLDHQPYHLEEAEKAGVDFLLSGHTHQGQVFPINLIVNRMYEQAHGYLRKGATHYYITSGLGVWGGKFRIGTQSEYLVATLRSQIDTLPNPIDHSGFPAQ